MCRSIKKLRGQLVSEEEIREAALQFVRKISGYNKPSKLNEAVFLAAVDDVTAASRTLLGSITENTRDVARPRS
jgi:hypothetical protein